MTALRSLALAATAVAALALGSSALAAPSPTRWCGPGESSVDLPDALNNAYQVHVIYAYPADSPDRFSERALPIARDIAAIDTWWQAQDSSRTPRFDLASFPACDTAFGQLDISSVRLPQPGAAYSSTDTIVDRLSHDLAAAGFADPDKKELVYYDGPVNEPGGGSYVCGESPTNILGGGPQAYAAVFLVPPCGDGLGDATSVAAATAHELIHNLGALADVGPPHICPDSPGHPCDSPNDILYPSADYGASLNTKQLDVGHDDYYGHSGTWWDVRNSPFLVHVGETFGAPQALAGLTATSSGASITISWQAAASSNGAVTYRVFRDGALPDETDTTSYADSAPVATTVTYEVEPQDALGFLGTPQTIRFTVGLGIVDAAGKIVRDTVPPTEVRTAQATKTRTGYLLRWSAATDAGGLRGYRVARNRRSFGPLVKGTSLAVPKAKARGAWTVTAVDAAGNEGRKSGTLTIR